MIPIFVAVRGPAKNSRGIGFVWISWSFSPRAKNKKQLLSTGDKKPSSLLKCRNRYLVRSGFPAHSRHYLFLGNSKSKQMKPLFVTAALVLALSSCGNSSDPATHTEDTTSPASGAAGQGLDGQGTRGGTGTGDTTGIDMGAAMPLDSSTNARPIEDVPGARRSNAGNDTNNGGQ